MYIFVSILLCIFCVLFLHLFYFISPRSCFSNRGNPGHPPNEDASSSAHIYMFNGVDLTTQTTTYDTHPGKLGKDNVTNGNVIYPPSTLVTPPFEPLHIKKLNFGSILCPPKSTIRKSTFNPNSHAVENFNNVEDLSQANCVMSDLEVLQHFPSQRKTLLAVIEAINLESSDNITLIWIILNHDSLTNFHSKLMLFSIINIFIARYWMREHHHVSCP
jgi:hypothetical protein